jgi:hypothetical protein
MRPAKLVRGYTLRDLFVVTTVAGIFCALGSLVTISEKGPSRRNTCANNMRQLSLAMAYYERAHRRFPGYANTVGGKTTTYVVPLFPQMERNDLHVAWCDQSLSTAQAPCPYLEVLVCPSSHGPARRPGTTSYVVNAGEAANELAADGVCFDRTRAHGLRTEVSLAYVNAHDGDAFTLLMSENLQAGPWVIDTPQEARRAAGFVWHDKCFPAAQCRINGAKNTPAGADRDISFARPSSNHLGGVQMFVLRRTFEVHQREY